LFDAIDGTTSTTAKVGAMAAYFRDAPPRDAAWGVYFLSGRKLKRLVSSTALRRWARELSGVEAWLFDECYSVVGDLAETISLLVRPAAGEAGVAGTPALTDDPLHEWIEGRLLPLRGMDQAEQRGPVVSWWGALPAREVFLLSKLLTGSLRVGVSQTLVERALAEVGGVDRAVIAHRLAGAWEPTPGFFASLLSGGDGGAEDTAAAQARPYPFFLASPVEDAGGVGSLGEVSEYLAEWKFDGIRAQLIRRGGGVALWSRGDELLTERFPEITEPAARLPAGTVLDGEVLAMRDGRPLAFSVLQRRIGRTNLTRALLAKAPAGFIAYDLLELGGTDLRERPLAERRRLLEDVLKDVPRLGLSERLSATTWEELAALRAESRSRNVEGLMLKRLDSAYGVGRKRGSWWKWKIDPLTADAVLVYAQPGHGRRAGLLTDYTFAVWDGAELVPFAKAYSGLDQAEIDELDRWIRGHSKGRFGPVRVVEPERVYELGFEAIAPSPRHRAGVAVRFPRILRHRTDKGPTDADTLASLRALIPAERMRPANDAGPTLFDP